MILFIEIMDAYNEFDQEMQILQLAIELVDENKTVYTSSHIFSYQFGIENTLLKWSGMQRDFKMGVSNWKEVLSSEIAHLNSLIEPDCKLIQWGDFGHYFSELKTNNRLNLKNAFKDKKSLENLYYETSGLKIPDRRAETRLSIIKQIYNGISDRFI